MNKDAEIKKNRTIIDHVKTVYKILSKRQRKYFWILQILMILGAVFEVIGLTSMIPFLGIMAKPEIIETNKILALLKTTSGLIDNNEFIFFFGLGVIFLMVFGNLFTIFISWGTFFYGHRTGQEWVSRLYRFYLNQNYIFHTRVNSSELTSNIIVEVGRVIHGVLIPLLRANSRFAALIILLLSLIIYNPFVSLLIVSILVLSYSLIYFILRIKLTIFGKKISYFNNIRFRTIGEGLGNIKLNKVHGNESFFANDFEKTCKPLANIYTLKSTFEFAPKYIIDIIVFGGLLSLLLYLFKNQSITFINILPQISFFVVVGYRTLPSIQQIFASFAQARTSGSPLEIIGEDLIRAKNQRNKNFRNNKTMNHSAIKLQNIHFQYPESPKLILNNFNLTINPGQTIGIAGETGSGKTTVVDLILGLIKPDKGQLLINDQKINEQNIHEWQNSVSYVPQVTFLTDDTIINNIALGVIETDIDYERINKSIQIAHLDPFINDLPLGLSTPVGERGVQLSGGQIQRIGIARALYRKASVLVFDEATSSVDSITESKITEMMKSLKGKMIMILIAHRISTLQACDIIYILKDGVISEQGSYHELIETSDYFRRLSKTIEN